MKIDQKKMASFLGHVESGYRKEIPYHNRAHAADVTLRMYSLLCNVIDIMSMEKHKACQLILSCMLAAAVHDYSHPGTNNQ